MTSQNQISARVPDWSREQQMRGIYEPWKQLLSVIRSYQRIKSGNGWRVLSPFLVLQHRFWSVVCGTDIPLNAILGGGLIMTHANGIVIHPDAKIGPNCLIFQQVTIGMGPKTGIPVIGGDVNIGAGAKILGGIHIGEHARIGANAVVLEDVAAGATAVGVPAQSIGGHTK
jgi:serine O-acetyltransferase